MPAMFCILELRTFWCRSHILKQDQVSYDPPLLNMSSNKMLLSTFLVLLKNNWSIENPWAVALKTSSFNMRQAQLANVLQWAWVSKDYLFLIIGRLMAFGCDHKVPFCTILSGEQRHKREGKKEGSGKLRMRTWQWLNPLHMYSQIRGWPSYDTSIIKVADYVLHNTYIIHKMIPIIKVT